MWGCTSARSHQGEVPWPGPDEGGYPSQVPMGVPQPGPDRGYPSQVQMGVPQPGPNKGGYPGQVPRGRVDTPARGVSQFQLGGTTVPAQGVPHCHLGGTLIPVRGTPILSGVPLPSWDLGYPPERTKDQVKNLGLGIPLGKDLAKNLGLGYPPWTDTHV